MERRLVSSSNIRSVGYDAENQILEIEFKKQDTVYQYLGVPAAVHKALLHSASKGKYFATHIKDFYRWRQVR